MESLLTKLGFQRRAYRDEGNHVFWFQGKSLILVTQDTTISAPAITGLGFVVEEKEIALLGTELDISTAMYYCLDPQGLKNYFVPYDSEDSNVVGFGFKPIPENKEHKNIGLTSISGVTYNCCQSSLLSYYETLGFRVTKQGEHYDQLTAKNNRFTIMACLNNDNLQVQNLIFETQDTFITTALCVANKIKLKHFDINRDELDFGKLSHLVYGYNCNASGNANSYTIENFIPDALPSIDIIFRMRKQFIDISEHTLRECYAAESEAK